MLASTLLRLPAEHLPAEAGEAGNSACLPFQRDRQAQAGRFLMGSGRASICLQIEVTVDVLFLKVSGFAIDGDFVFSRFVFLG